MTFLFLNQFVPPDPAPTARLLGDLAEELKSRGHEVLLVGDRIRYRGTKTLLGSRALREGLSLLRLLARTILSRRADTLVFLSSPPLLPVVARWSKLRHRRARFVHWAMDLYPEVAVALGEVGENSLLHRLTSSSMGHAYRACDTVVALDADMASQIALHGPACEIHPPWPPSSNGPPPTVHSPPPSANRPFRWLYSGNLGRAHEWQTLLEAQKRLEEAGSGAELVFQGGGAERASAMRHAETIGLQQCHWLPYADEEELIPSLLAADCLVATQRPETRGCLWPSKLALALLLERPLVWIGAEDGSVAALLREKGHACFVPGAAEELASHLSTLPKAMPGPTFDTVGKRIDAIRSEGIGKLADLLENSK